MTVKHAQIHFNEQGTPVASDFDDVYFSNANGLQETQYVFLANNGLPGRWKQWQKDEFIIAETGFGTGLNFLVTWHCFCQYLAENTDSALRRLHFISVEKFPLAKQDLTKALAAWPQLKHLADALLRQYPKSVAGCHRLVFDQGQIILDLNFGDVEQVLPQCYTDPQGLVDAWYLDGFAPSKNPQMWQQSLFQQMARLARQGCTYATFTAAGMVKRGLAAAGFKVEKRPGFGHKRDMLGGALIDLPDSRAQAGYFHRGEAIGQSKQISIIGAGLAGASAAYALTQKGYRVKVYFKEALPAAGASGNSQGGFYPQLNAEASITSQIQALSFLFASRQYHQLLSDGYHFAHDFCGVLQLAFNSKVLARYQKLVDNQVWPDDLVKWLSPSQTTAQAGISLPYNSLYFSAAGWISPPALVRALLQAANVQGQCKLCPEHQLTQLTYQDSHWKLDWQHGKTSQAETLVLATGSHSDRLLPLKDLPLRMIRGQVETIPSQAPIDQLTAVLCHKGYLTPAYQGYHALGSTYMKNDVAEEYREQEQTLNLQTQSRALAECDWPQSLVTENQGRASIRCSSPDHLPLVGAVPDLDQQQQQFAALYKAKPADSYPRANNFPNLYMLTALGSRGLTTAPLMAELLASQIAGSPLPLSNNLVNALNPNRFLVRDLIRRNLS